MTFLHALATLWPKIKQSIPIICMLLLHIFFVFMFSYAHAQPPENGEAVEGQITPIPIGLKVPEEFWTKEHCFFIGGDTVRQSLQEHRGKMIVLDFWFSGCAKCLLDQKQIKQFKEKYKDNLVVVMVNSRTTREGYEKLKKLDDKKYFERFGIRRLETIIEDEYLLSLFPHAVYSHYVWINEIERPQLMTSSNRMTSRMYQVLKADEVNGRGERQILVENLGMLTGVDFNINAQLRNVFLLKATPTYSRDTGTGALELPVFKAKNKIKAPGGGTHAQLQLVALEFDATDPSADSVSIAQSNYLDIGRSDDTEAEVLTVDLQPKPESAVLIMMGIAYFQFVNGGYYPLANGQYNALTIVDVDIP